MVKLQREGGSTNLLQRRIDAVKAGVSVPELAEFYMLAENGKLKRSGERWRGVCPLCGNGQHSLAFSCTRDLWKCFACNEGGDVITLAQRKGGGTFGEVVAWLGFTFDIDLPGRPDSWYSKQDRQARTREALEEKKRNVKRRRIFRVIMVPLLESWGAGEDEVKAAWRDFRNLPV